VFFPNRAKNHILIITSELSKGLTNLQVDHSQPGLLPGHVEELLGGPNQVVVGQIHNFQPVQMIENLEGKQNKVSNTLVPML
jgi:hypothetical protein